MEEGNSLVACTALMPAWYTTLLANLTLIPQSHNEKQRLIDITRSSQLRDQRFKLCGYIYTEIREGEDVSIDDDAN